MNANVLARLKPRFYILIAVLLAFLAAVLWWRGRGSEAVNYVTELVDRGGITQTVSANGTLNPVTLVSVGTQVSGTVEKLLVDFNDRVKAGQVLVTLDDALIRATLAQDVANLAAAESALRVANNNRVRVRELAKEGFVSQQELDAAEQASEDAQARVTQLRAAVEKDRANLSYTVIRSPVSGVVVLRAVDAGQTVAASFNTPELFKIAKDLREMQIDAYFAEADVGQIKVGMPVSFRVDAFADQRFSGQVKQIRINPKIDSNVVTYNVVVGVSNPDEKLLPGMTAYVDVTIATRENVLRLPNAALRFHPSIKLNNKKTDAEKTGASKRHGKKSEAGATVYRVNVDGELESLRVTTGIADRRYTEIVEVVPHAGAQKPDSLRSGSALVVDDLTVDDSKKPTQGMQMRM